MSPSKKLPDSSFKAYSFILSIISSVIARETGILSITNTFTNTGSVTVSVTATNTATNTTTESITQPFTTTALKGWRY